MPIKKEGSSRLFFILGTLIFFLFCSKEIANFYQTGHAGFINAEVGLSHMNTINNGFLKTKLGSTNHKFIYDRAPEPDEYYVRYPHLHNLLMSLLWTITGPSEIAAQIFAILLVFASFFTFFFVARELQFSRLAASLSFLALCCFPVMFHYARLSNGEISALLFHVLSLFFYIKLAKTGRFKHRLLFLVMLSVTCQLFWYGYITAFVFFLDTLWGLFLRKEKKNWRLAADLVGAVAVNIGIFIIHTIWMVGSIKKVFEAFLWRAGIDVPATQTFSLGEYLVNNLNRWWLFNPLVILLALINLFFVFKKRQSAGILRLKRRIYIILILAPLLFMALLSHLVNYHDFLVLYFAFFLALSSAETVSRIVKKMGNTVTAKTALIIYGIFLVAFAGYGLFHPTEEKMIDKERDNYELYYVLKVISHTTQPSEHFLLTLNRDQMPQVRFYLRRESSVVHVLPWAKGYVESGRFDYYLVDGRDPYKPLVKYLLHNYRAYKYDRYFLFDIRKKGSGLRVFKREKRKTGLLFKYFVSFFHQPGGYQEITDRQSIKNVYNRLEGVPDLYKEH
ncbi:MAG: hypothetical protein JXB26_17525 [Candidatus Aminicenantes bacterium]|nr:hypothetical protein [Candidatus Aminicenantes bacterium]